MYMVWPCFLALVVGAGATFLRTEEQEPAQKLCGASGHGDGCAALAAMLGDKVFLPNSSVYQYENTQFWSNTELLTPACVFRPNSTSDVASGIVAMRQANAQFAIRGGGHANAKGANNIDGGVLLVLSNLSRIAVDVEKSTVSIGPSYRWGDAYKYLEKSNLATLGGRLSSVGVPGMLLAGGVSFHGNQHGFAADNVVEYEVVLANGTVVTATATQHPDLFWGLKGGMSNFGIVTNFVLRTYPSTRVWGGTYTVSGEHVDAFLAAAANYSAFNTDPLSHIVPFVAPQPASNTTVGSVIMFYDSPTVEKPACFAPFLEIPSIASTLGFTTVADLAVANGALVTDHINDVFIGGSTVGKDYDALLKGYRITNKVFLDALPALFAKVPASIFVLLSIDWQPIGPLWAAGSARANPGGNALGIDVASKGTYLAWAEVVEWRGDEHNDAIFAWIEQTTAAINAATRAAGIYDGFVYMGDSAAFQTRNFFDGYGAANKARLLAVSRAYDPERLFQTLIPGGYKIGA